MRDTATDLDDQLILDRLNEAQAGRWRIWRSVGDDGRSAAWIATNIGVPGAAPSLHGATPERLEKQLDDPPRRCGGPLPDVGAILQEKR